MSEHNDKFSSVPLAACRLAGGEIALGANGETAKTAPIRLKARSGQPIEHWYWGRVVHDLAGMRLAKKRLPVDYAHNESEVLGYVNHFDSESGDLWAGGALTPWRDDDRASEVMFKMREGVQYEASIFFGGDGIKYEEVPEGAVAPVNGYQFAGPGVIIREWPLRGIAICPYGADQNTEASTFKNGETVAATKIEKRKDEAAMSEQAVEVEAGKEGEQKPVEVPAVETEAKVEAPTVEAQLSALKAQQDADKAEIALLTADASANAAKVTELTAANAGLVAERDGLKADYDGAQQRLAKAEADLEEVGKKLAAMMSGAPPVSAMAAEKSENSGTLMERARKSK